MFRISYENASVKTENRTRLRARDYLLRRIDKSNFGFKMNRLQDKLRLMDIGAFFPINSPDNESDNIYVYSSTKSRYSNKLERFIFSRYEQYNKRYRYHGILYPGEFMMYNYHLSEIENVKFAVSFKQLVAINQKLSNVLYNDLTNIVINYM